MFPHLGLPPTSSILIQFWRLSRGNAGTWNTGAATTGLHRGLDDFTNEYRGSTAKLNQTEDFAKCRFIMIYPNFIPNPDMSKSFKIYGRMMLYEGDNLVKFFGPSRWIRSQEDGGVLGGASQCLHLRGVVAPAKFLPWCPSEVSPFFFASLGPKGLDVSGGLWIFKLHRIGWWEHVSTYVIRAQLEPNLMLPSGELL